MKFFKYIVFSFLIVFTACKTTRNATDSSTLKGISAKKVIKKHVSNNFNEKTVDAKLKVNFKNEKQNVGFSVRMKIKKDEVIWLKGSKIITVFKAKITPEKISFYSPYYKNYIEGDFSMLENLLGTSVNFKQLQNMLLGQAMFSTSGKQRLQLSENAYKISPKEQADLFAVFYWINKEHYKLDKQSLINEGAEQRLDIVYPSYKEIDKVFFPEKIEIKGKTKNTSSDIDITVRSVLFNEEISIPFKIPNGYKEIEL